MRNLAMVFALSAAMFSNVGAKQWEKDYSISSIVGAKQWEIKDDSSDSIVGAKQCEEKDDSGDSIVEAKQCEEKGDSGDSIVEAKQCEEKDDSSESISIVHYEIKGNPKLEAMQAKSEGRVRISGGMFGTLICKNFYFNDIKLQSNMEPDDLRQSLSQIWGVNVNSISYRQEDISKEIFSDLFY